jgi:hypothetical protein
MASLMNLLNGQTLVKELLRLEKYLVVHLGFKTSISRLMEMGSTSMLRRLELRNSERQLQNIIIILFEKIKLGKDSIRGWCHVLIILQ